MLYRDDIVRLRNGLTATITHIDPNREPYPVEGKVSFSTPAASAVRHYWTSEGRWTLDPKYDHNLDIVAIIEDGLALTARPNLAYTDGPPLPALAGLPLRDVFAGLAMQAMVVPGANAPNVVAARAYEYADAMINARKDHAE